MVEKVAYSTGGDCDNCEGNLEWIGDGACDGAAYMTEGMWI